MEVIVIGAGVSGLTTAIRLLERGHEVVIWAKERLADTTSHVAAATWIPYAVGGDHAVQWAEESLAAFRALMTQAPPEVSGIVAREFHVLSQRPQADPPWMTSAQAQRLMPEELRQVGYAWGLRFSAPVVDMSIYLGYLEAEVRRRHGRIVHRSVSSWAEVMASWQDAFPHEPSSTETRRAIINCAGLGARELVGRDQDQRDSSDGLGVHAARGQVVRIASQGFEKVLLNEDDPSRPTYVVPRLHDIILGGTYQEGEEARLVESETHDDILKRCADLLIGYDQRFALSVAALAGEAFAAEFGRRLRPDTASRVVKSSPVTPIGDVSDDCGLRPARAEVCLKGDALTPAWYLVHNYGHGGSGVTLSWGCANEVAALLSDG